MPPQLTEDWKRWIQVNLERGCAVADLVNSMSASGFADDVARAHIQAAVRNSSLRNDAQWARVFRAPGWQDLNGHRCMVHLTLATPNLALVGGFLTASECALIQQLAEPQLELSRVVSVDSGQAVRHDARTSMGTYFLRGAVPELGAIEARLAALTGLPLEHGEGLQVLRYGPGGRYIPHFDFFAPEVAGSQAHVSPELGGQRAASVVMYLNTVAAGGETEFPTANIRIAPVQGHACYFSYLTRQGALDRTSLHGGSPVIAGEKWIATWWARVGKYGA